MSAPAGVALAALIISIGTFCKTLYTDLRGWMKGRGATFEANVGSAVRVQLRAYDKSISTLRSFSLINPAPLDDQKAEIEKYRPDWLNANYELGRLLEEVDQHPNLVEPGWASRFNARMERAEDLLISLTDPTITSATQLQDQARLAHEELRAAIAEVRESLLHEQSSYSGIFRRLPAWWRRQFG